MRHEPTVVPTAQRLRRLRWWMALMFAVANVGGLAILAAVALRVDSKSRVHAEMAEVRRRVTAAADLVYYDDSPDGDPDGAAQDGQLVTQWLADDDASDGHPEVYVVVRAGPHLSGTRLTVVFAGRDRRHDVADGWLTAAARDAMDTESDQISHARDTRGRGVYLLASPLYADPDSDAPSGAVVAVGDPLAGQRAHNRLLWALLASIGGLAAASTAVGFLLSGYAVRPALANLSAQERFLADAAHELRTPVAALQASAEAALTEHSGSVESAVVVRHTRRLGAVIDALLTRARLSAGVQSARREPLRLDLLVEDEIVAAGLDPAEVVEHADEVVVRADPTLLRLGVRNLLDNAVRHGHRPDEPARVRVTVAAGLVRVGDSGPGVSGDLLRGAFGRYRSGADGSGLGVSIASEVAVAHGGRLEAANDPAGGAVFTLRLP